MRAIPEDGGVHLPIDPDLDAVEQPPSSALRRDALRRRRWLRLRSDVVLAVFVGGCLGGEARYAIAQAWATPAGRFPWATFAVNVAGAFVLALVIVIATDVVSSRYLRPLLGTGFCGAFTTFSSIVVTTDLLFAHHHAGTAVAYLAANVVAGLAAAALGLVLARAATTRRRDRSP